MYYQIEKCTPLGQTKQYGLTPHAPFFKTNIEVYLTKRYNLLKGSWVLSSFQVSPLKYISLCVYISHLPRQDSKHLILRLITVIISCEDLTEWNFSMCALFLLLLLFFTLTWKFVLQHNYFKILDPLIFLTERDQNNAANFSVRLSYVNMLTSEVTLWTIK